MTTPQPDLSDAARQAVAVLIEVYGYLSDEDHKMAAKVRKAIANLRAALITGTST